MTRNMRIVTLPVTVIWYTISVVSKKTLYAGAGNRLSVIDIEKKGRAKKWRRN